MMKDTERHTYESFLQYRDALEDYACSLLGSRQDAQDMVQDLYLKLWGRRDSIGEIDSPKAYCFSVIKRQCLDLLKSAQRKNEAQMPLDLESPQAGIEERLAQREQLAETLKEVESLSAGQREVLLKNAVDGCSYEEISSQTGLKPQMVRTQMSLARKNLRARTAWLFAAAAVILGIFVWALRPDGTPKELQDTYSDPYMAYSQIEKSFKKIGDSMEKGSQKARESEHYLQPFRRVFENN